MNVNVNTSLKGQYTIYDENMNVLSETENLITDWGMSRFVGDRSVGSLSDQPANYDDSILAFCTNISQIFLGTGTSTPSVTSWKLDNRIPASEYTVTVHRSTTGTTLSAAPDDNLAIIFTNVQRYKFNSTLTQPSYVVRELGCSWSQTLSANNRYGIFSRAVLPPTPVISVAANSIIYVKYKLTIITDCSQIKSSMINTVVGNGIPLPPNKTNVRRLPLYSLKNDNTPTEKLNKNDEDTNSEYIQPLFEDMQLWNYNYVGNAANGGGAARTWQNNTFGTSKGTNDAYKTWWLQFYRSSWTFSGSVSAVYGGANPLQRYLTLTSTTSSLLGNSSDIAVIHGGKGGNDYSSVVFENLTYNSNFGRKNADFCTINKINDSTWVRTISFVFAPQELGSDITVLKLYPATLGNWNYGLYNPGWYLSTRGSVYIDDEAQHNNGIVTVLNAPYTPAPDNFVGFTYQFAFTRN